MPKQSLYPTFTPIATDYLSGTDDPSGTPAHGNVEINSALANLLASLITDVNGANQLAQLNGSALVSVANLPNSSTSQRGIVQQATDGEVAASKVVQSNDSRLHVLNDASTANDEVFSAEKILALVDAVTAGIDHKDPVVTTTEGEGNITLSGEQTLNSVLTSASRVLVTEQTDASENGIYITDSGSWTRATDCDEDAEVTNGLTVYVTDSNSDKYGYHYVLTTSDPITVGTTVLSFAEIPLVAVSHTHSASDLVAGGSFPAIDASNLTGIDVTDAVSVANRGTANPHLGGNPNQPFQAIDNKDNSASIRILKGRVEVINEYGPFGTNVNEDPDEPDVEIWLGDKRLSMISGDSDLKDANGGPARQNFNFPDLGSRQTPLIISGMEY